MQERENRRRKRQKDKRVVITSGTKKLTHNFSVDFLLVIKFFFEYYRNIKQKKIV